MWKIKIIEKKITPPPVEVLLEIVNRYRGIFLFTSGRCRGNNILGINPVLTLTDNSIKTGDRVTAIIDPLAAIDEILEKNRTSHGELFSPFLLGYISYDYKHHLEEKGIYIPQQQGFFPGICFSLFQYYLIYHPGNGEGSLVELSFPFEYRKVNRDEVTDCLSGRAGTGAGEQIKKSYYRCTSLEKNAFEEGVRKIIDYIRAGDIYQVNLTRSIKGTTEYSPEEIAALLYRSNDIEFGVYARIEDSYVISTSPERFFRIKRGRILTSPIKGTIKKTGSRETDASNSQKLLASKKNLAELAMIVDLLRNDISRFCKPGSVIVKGYPLLKELYNVYHLVADIEGELMPDSGFRRIMEALFPGGSISGCPKIRACRIIDELEPEPRGLYTGSFGYIGFNGDMDFNIMIRSLFLRGSEFIFNTGGGITLLSDPTDEYEETIYKIKNIYSAINLEEVWEERYCLTDK